MQFRRVDALPPYAFAEVDRLKLELRRAGEDVVDLGFGNPNVPPPPVAVDKLREAAEKARNHRYSSSRGLPRLREAVCDLYRTRYGVELDPETEATLALGAKEGLVHLLWVLLGPGDVAREPELVLVHDFAYADLGFDGHRPPSIFEAEGAREVAVELYSLTKGFSLAGWRVAFVLGRADVVAALARLKSYLDYGSFQPLQIAATVALRDAPDWPREVADVYRGRRDA